nr:unnamed protein product [Digitaria exilis]
MALPSRLAQLQAKACEATRFVAKHGCAYQRSLVEKNSNYVVEPPTIEKCRSSPSSSSTPASPVWPY